MTPEPNDERNTGLEKLKAIMAEMSHNAAKSGLSPEQIDAIIDAECEAVRYGRDIDKSSTEAAELDLKAIREGIADMEAGRVVSLEDIDVRIRARLKLPPKV
jgi:predicted transcriptional regulator